MMLRLEGCEPAWTYQVPQLPPKLYRNSWDEMSVVIRSRVNRHRDSNCEML